MSKTKDNHSDNSETFEITNETRGKVDTARFVVYRRRRASEMKVYSFSFPSRGERKKVEKPAAYRGRV